MNSGQFLHTDKENLHFLLPKGLRDDLEDNFNSPKSKKTCSELKMTPSPQIPPLESRLHSYMLKKADNQTWTKPCNLAEFFNHACITGEIQSVLKDIPRKVKAFEHLENSGFFEMVKKEVVRLRKSVKSRLSAQATSFVPTDNKENLCVKLKH